jgi:HAD superfamily hydrolase (TIGR01509 family)
LNFEGLILDFDGVLLESEYAGNKQIADYLTAIGHPTSPEQSMANFMGLADAPFRAAIERWIGRPLPEDFHVARAEEDRRALDEGLPAVAGALRFVERLPDELPRAIASSSSTSWIRAHLDHLGIGGAFPLVFSGREHVVRGKPAPDLYLHAAQALGVDIRRTLIVEDSPVGAEGALASGATVIGLVAGSHCGPDHGDRLRALGVERIAAGFDEVAEALGL